MRAIAVCGSSRAQGNTEILLDKALSILESEGIAGQLVRLSDKTILPCRACGACGRQKDKTCAVKDDDFDEVFRPMLKAEVIIVGSPVYFGSATPQLMALLDRAGYVSRANGGLFERKLGGPITVARRAGQNFTYAQLLYWYMINDMIVPGSTYWNVAFGHAVGEVNQDVEGLETITRFAQNLAWLAKQLYA